MYHQDVVTTADDPNDERLQGSHWNKAHIWKTQDEPDDPADGTSIPWMSNGNGYGDPYDIVVKVNGGGVIKYFTLCDFSGGATIGTTTPEYAESYRYTEGLQPINY